jgi:hypothetical protein
MRKQILSSLKRAAAFLKKAAQKTFAPLEPVALKQARPSLAKFFCYFLLTKSSLPLR